MKIKQGDDCCNLPDVGMLECVALKKDGHLYRMCIVKNEELSKFQRESKLQGNPIYCALFNNTLRLFPESDGDYEVIIRYYPPMVEI